MNKYKRVFLLVADSAGIGEEPDAAKFGDVGTNTWVHAAASVGGLNVPVMESFGVGELADIPGVKPIHKHPPRIQFEDERSLQRQRYDDGPLGDDGYFDHQAFPNLH